MHKAYVEVELGGENKLLKYDFNAVADIEEYFGKGIGAIMTEENLGFRAIRALYWAGLKWKDRGLTMERVGHLIGKELQEGRSFQELILPIGKALQASKLIGKKQADDEDTEDFEPKN
jgi:hypothetical protein